MWLRLRLTRAPFSPPVELKDDKLCLCFLFFLTRPPSDVFFLDKSQHLHVALVICVSLWNTWQQ